ncbi:MAG: adenylate/guanylate cyclase domain-containing protein [Verrucomicrobia bacterium]|nr:adenylate/guanylate cyclase domain-containing protein [Verrucomicrobiota bacterium]
MRLSQADVHLHRARLFRDKEELKRARALIEQCDYWHRKQELEDAEEAAKSWPDAISPIPERKQTMHKTVVELDLVGYSTIAENLEQALGVETSPKLNAQIQGFIDQGLAAVRADRARTVMATTGDGAILVFDAPSAAHSFAEAVHASTREHNKSKDKPIGKRVFRIGAATGELVMEPKAGGGYEIAGMTIARAVRLEAKAKPGELLVDTGTYEGLERGQQKFYAARETILGKRDEKFDAHRCVFNPDGVKDAEYFTGKSAASEMRNVTGVKPGDKKALKKEILGLFKQLKAHQFDDLIFLLDMPIGQRPPNTLPTENRKTYVLEWAEQEADGLQTLAAELRDLVGLETSSRP